MFKDFGLSDRFNLEFRAEAFNLTNTAGYFIENDQNQQPTTNQVAVFTPPAASVFAEVMQTNPNYLPRQLQFALKLKF